MLLYKIFNDNAIRDLKSDHCVGEMPAAFLFPSVAVFCVQWPYLPLGGESLLDNGTHLKSEEGYKEEGRCELWIIPWGAG